MLSGSLDRLYNFKRSINNMNVGQSVIDVLMSSGLAVRGPMFVNSNYRGQRGNTENQIVLKCSIRVADRDHWIGTFFRQCDLYLNGPNNNRRRRV